MSNANITKRIMADAVKRQMAERPLSKISVGDIVEECGLNRNSFYYHFKDKYDLVNWIFYTDFVAKVDRSELNSYWKLIERMCCFLYEDKAFYINALSETGQNSFTEYFSGFIETAVRARIDHTFEDEEFKKFYASFFIDAFISCISRWLREGAEISPEKLVEFMKKATVETEVQKLWDIE